MAITNFPDTSINNPATGGPWVAGETFSDSESGITYTWSPPVWKTDGENGPYVQVGGDNMVGDLTLGTDKITLDATAGSATFSGTIVTTDGSGQVALFSNGRIRGYNVAEDGSTFLFQGNSGVSNTTKFQVDNDGSADFAGVVSN